MCDPISIAGAALSGAGMAANSIASNEVQHATNAAEQQTQFLNGIQQNRINAANASADAQYQGFQAGQAAKGQQLGDVLSAQSVGNPARSYMPPSMSANTNANTAMQEAPMAAYGTQQARSLGNMRSFGDYLANTNRAAGRDLQTADQAANFMRGNSAVEGLELNQAQHAGDTAGLFGKLLGGVGGLGIKAGLTGTGGLGGLFGASSADAAQDAAQNATYF